jgi:GTPase SAR1 family protein/RNase P subunit RPR2
MADRFAYDVFLSHNSKDKPRVRELADKLRAAGLRVWFDEWALKPGDDIYLAIERGLEAARAQVLCLSPAALGSEWVALERSTVLFRDPANSGRRFIPLLLADCDLPDALRRYTYVDYRRKTKAALAELLAACRFETESVPPVPKIKSTKKSAQPPEQTEPLAVLERELTGHEDWVRSVAFSSDGTWSASGSDDLTVRIWDLKTGACPAMLGHTHNVYSVAITPDGKRILGSSDNSVRVWDASSYRELAKLDGHANVVWSVVALRDNARALSGGIDNTLRLWNLATGQCLKTIECGTDGADGVFSTAVDPAGTRVLSGHRDGRVQLWDLGTGQCLATLKGHSDAVKSVQVTPDGRFGVSGSEDKTVKIWDLEAGVCVGTLEGHQSHVYSVAISPDGNLIASTGFTDKTVRLWDWRSGGCLQVIKHEIARDPISVAFSPLGSRLLVGTTNNTIYVYRLTGVRSAPPAEATRRYVNAKVVLIGEGTVGKTSLAYRLIEDRYVVRDRTHGMNVWLLDLPLPPDAMLQREALLWDLAGQEDYRLIHRLFLEETALALLLINPQKDDPFAEAGDWLKTLETAASHHAPGRRVPRLLVFSQIDVGGMKISNAKIERFREQHGFVGWLATSAKTGEHCSDTKSGGEPSKLKQMIADHIPWSTLPWTATPRLLAELKNAVMTIRDKTDIRLLRFSELAQRLEQALPGERFGESEMRTAVTLLANHGLARPLKFGDLILLRPDLLNGYAGAIIRAARAHRDEIGSVSEAGIYGPDFDFTGVDRLNRPDEELLLRAMVQTFLDHSLCIAEETPQGRHLVFPSQYRREKDIPWEPDVFVSYTFSGEWQTVWTTLVVRLWYSQEFEHKELWRNAAELQSSRGHLLGLKIDNRQGEGQATISLFFDVKTPDELKVIFIEYVHRHLAKYASDVTRDRRYVCPICARPVTNLDAVRRRLETGKGFITCQHCDERIPLIDIIEQRLASDLVARKILSMEEIATRELDTQAGEQILIGHMMAVCAEANQIFRPVKMFDYGIDGELEFKDNDGKASGKKIYVQLKSSNSYLRTRRHDGREVFDVKNERHLDYWISQPVDVYLVRYQADEQSRERTIRWMNVTRYLKSRKVKASREIVFEGEPLDMQAVWRARDHQLVEFRQDKESSKKNADKLAREGFSQLEAGALSTARTVFMDSLGADDTNVDAIAGLIRVAQRSLNQNQKRYREIIADLIEISPQGFAAQICTGLQIAEATLIDELQVTIRDCPLPILSIADETNRFGWTIQLAPHDNPSGIELIQPTLRSESVALYEVRLCCDVGDLPWGEYDVLVKLVVASLNAWSAKSTINNSEPKNVYQFGPPIENPKSFFGRKQFIQDLTDQLELASINLIGPRRSGKTSTLYRVKKECTDDWTTVFIDLQGFSLIDPPKMPSEMLRRIYKQCDVRAPRRTGAAGFRHLPELLTQHGVKKLLLLVDEIGFLAQFPALALHLRHMAKWLSPRTRIVTAGTEADLNKVCNAVDEHYPGSPPFNEFVNLELTEISDQDARDLVTEPLHRRYRYDPYALETLVRLGAGRPFFLNALAALALKAVQRERGRLVQQKHIDAARKEAQYELRRWYPDFIKDLPTSLAEELVVLLKSPDCTLPHYMVLLLRSAGLTIGPRSEARLDPLFIDWWHLNNWQGERQ